MKRFLTILLVALTFGLLSNAYALPNFWYVGIASNLSGQLVPSSSVDVRITIKQGGSTVFQQTFSSVSTDAFSTFTVNVNGAGLGSVTMTANTQFISEVRYPAGSSNAWKSVAAGSLAQIYSTTIVTPGSITLPTNQVLIGNSTNNAVAAPVAGDLTASYSGGNADFQIAAGAVGTNELANNAVTSAKILDGEIVDADISNTAGINVSKLSVTQNNLIVGNASNVGSLLAPGSNGQVLAISGGAPTWTTLPETDPIWTADQSSNLVTISGNWTITGDFDNTTNPWADNEVADNLTINGGTIDNSVIGGTTPAAGTFTILTATTSNLGTVVSGAWNGSIIMDAYVDNSLTITAGSIDGTPIGGTTPAAGTFTNLQVNGTLNDGSGTGTTGQVLAVALDNTPEWTTLSTLETDPEVNMTTTNAVPRWNGTQLVDGSISDSTNTVSVGSFFYITVANGNTTTNGDLTVKGNTTLGDGSSDQVTFYARVASDVVPSSDNNFDLGSATFRWNDIFLGGNVSVEGNINNPTGNVVVNDNLQVNNNLSVTQNSTLTGAVTAQNGITVTSGGINVTGGATIQGSATISTGDFNMATGNIYAGDGTVNVTSNTEIGTASSRKDLTVYGSTILGYQTAANIAALNGLTNVTVVGYTGAGPINLTNLPAATANGQVLWLINLTGGILNVDGVLLSNDEMIGFVYAAGSWHRMP